MTALLDEVRRHRLKVEEEKRLLVADLTGTKRELAEARERIAELEEGRVRIPFRGECS